MASDVRRFSCVHPVYMPPQKSRPRPKKPLPKKNFIRQWRLKIPGLTLEKLADRLATAHDLSITHASLSRIERGIQPYSQPILEALAAELTKGDVASLLIRNPDDPEGIWSLWDRAEPAERNMIVDLARTVIKGTGTKG